MKAAIVTDSNSGITQQQAKDMGVYVLPMPFLMGDTTYYEDIDLTQEEFYQRLKTGMDISTSQPAPAAVMDLWNQLLGEYDQVVYIPMSSGLSGSCQTAVMLSEEFNGRVRVVNNQRISVTQRQSVLDAKLMADQGMDGDAICKKLEETKFESSIYIMVDTLEYLKKGGRITPAAALLGTVFKIKPVLTIQGEKLDAFAKARTVKQAKTMMITAIKKDLEERFSDAGGKNSYLAVAHTDNLDAAQELKRELQEQFPAAGDIYIDHLSLNVSCHIGPGALAVACTKKII